MELYNYGLAQSATPMDCTSMTQVVGEVIGGNQPDGTERRIVFKIGSGNWQKWDSSTSSWIDVPTQNLTDISVLAEGNTVSEITALTNIPAFVGKQISVAVAMKALVGATNFPSITIATKGKTPKDVYTETKEWDEQTLKNGEEVEIEYFVVDSAVTGGTLKVEVSYYANGVWSRYIDVTEFKAEKASKVMYRTTATVNEVGVGLVQVNSISAVYAA